MRARATRIQGRGSARRRRSISNRQVAQIRNAPVIQMGRSWICGTTEKPSAASVQGRLALICFLGVLVSYNNEISGVGPGSALLAIMAALKLLETRKRRDQFVLLFISIFLVMSSLLREQYLWSLPYLLFGVLLIMTGKYCTCGLWSANAGSGISTRARRAAKASVS